MLSNSGFKLSGVGGFSDEFLDSQLDRYQVESLAFGLLMLGVRESFGGQLNAGTKLCGKTVCNAGHSTIPETSNDCCRVLAGYEGMTKGILTPSGGKLMEDSVKRWPQRFSCDSVNLTDQDMPVPIGGAGGRTFLGMFYNNRMVRIETELRGEEYHCLAELLPRCHFLRSNNPMPNAVCGAMNTRIGLHVLYVSRCSLKELNGVIIRTVPQMPDKSPNSGAGPNTNAFDDHPHDMTRRTATCSRAVASFRSRGSQCCRSIVSRTAFAAIRSSVTALRRAMPGILPTSVSATAFRMIWDIDLLEFSANLSRSLFSVSDSRNRIVASFMILTLLLGFHRGVPLGLLPVFTRAWLATAGHSKLCDNDKRIVEIPTGGKLNSITSLSWLNPCLLSSWKIRP
jgi:hypothetical protein